MKKIICKECGAEYEDEEPVSHCHYCESENIEIED